MLALRAKRPRPVMSTATIPAPTKGINLRDGIASLKVDEAMILDNWMPREGFCQVRGGHTSHATGLGSTPLTHMEWAGPSSRKAFAATAADIFEVTSAGAVGAAAVSGLASGYWQHVNFTTAGGAFLVFVNGADAARNYDGSSFTTPAITNVSSSTFINVASHKSRLWFVALNSTKAWYLPTSSIAGAAAGFELGDKLTQGGSLKAIGSVSTDAGDAGSDDFLCFISSRGEVVVYRGTDPASADTWALAGVYRVAPPIGYRCVEKIGGDLAILTEAGVISVRQLIVGGRAGAERAAVTARIGPGIADAFAAYGQNNGWQMIVHPRSRQLIANVPKSSSTAFQFAMNTQGGGWCTYGKHASPLNATCWGTLSEGLYFGTSAGTIWRAENGHQDNGAAITGEIKTSFQPYGRRGGVSRITQVRPLFTAGGRIVPGVRVNDDFQNSQPMTTDEYPVSAGSLGSSWGSGLWGTATWGGSDQPYADWVAAQGIGTTASIHLVTRTSGIDAKLNAIDVMYEMAGALAL